MDRTSFRVDPLTTPHWCRDLWSSSSDPENNVLNQKLSDLVLMCIRDTSVNQMKMILGNAFTSLEFELQEAHSGAWRHLYIIGCPH